MPRTDRATSTIATAESPGQRLRRRAYESLPLLVCLLAVAFLSVRINKGIYLGDEGVSCMAGWCVAQGQTPVAALAGGALSLGKGSLPKPRRAALCAVALAFSEWAVHRWSLMSLI